MRPANTSNSAGFRWNSPLPYLFGGLAAMMGLIAIALIILACSYRRSRHHSSDDMAEKPTKPTIPAAQEDLEPKIVVIMPGEDGPTFIARPINPIHLSQEQ